MSRGPSETTQLRQARTEVRRLTKQLARAYNDRDIYRARATKTEEDVVEWKKRFDALLLRVQLIPAKEDRP